MQRKELHDVNLDELWDLLTDVDDPERIARMGLEEETVRAAIRAVKHYNKGRACGVPAQYLVEWYVIQEQDDPRGPPGKIALTFQNGRGQYKTIATVP